MNHEYVITSSTPWCYHVTRFVVKRSPTPFNFASYQTIMGRAVDPKISVILSQRNKTVEGPVEDPMMTPYDVLKRSRDAVKAFQAAFPLEKRAEKGNGRRDSRSQFWKPS